MTIETDPMYYVLVWKNTETGEIKPGKKQFVAYDQKSIDDHITSLNLGTSDHINYEAEIVSLE